MSDDKKEDSNLAAQRAAVQRNQGVPGKSTIMDLVAQHQQAQIDAETREPGVDEEAEALGIFEDLSDNPNEPGSGLEPVDALKDPPAGEAPPQRQDIPAWVKTPPGFVYPRGRVVSFVRFRADWTDIPSKGERQCVIWYLTSNDEKVAIARTRGDSLRTLAENTKQMVRVIDGRPVDKSGKPGAGNIDGWWNEIGAKCRQQLMSWYLKTHALSAEERVDFFVHCVAVRTLAE